MFPHVARVYCGKTADWIRMPFGMVNGVSQEWGVLDRDGYRRREWAVLGVNVGRFIVTGGILCVRGGDALFLSDFGEDLMMNIMMRT